jgi:hypothetical protein
MPVSIVVESVTPLSNHAAEIRLRSDHLALFVVLTTRAQGRFSENAFILRPTETKVSSEIVLLFDYAVKHFPILTLFRFCYFRASHLFP